MPSIDDKVVAMSFENGKFERGVSQTRDSLDKLKKSLEFPNAGKGLDNINASANRINLGHIANDVDTIKGKFGALSVAALAVFATIASRAVSAGAQMVKAFTITPVLQGLQLYESKLQAVQTILANTQSAGTKMADVNKVLAQLNDYSNKTIYNFGQMTKNIGTFTAAGVDLKTSTSAIKGIANLAALSGSNADQASTAMYQLSQAIAAGQVHLQDWNSVVNAGMGGTVFQRALATTAVAMGKLKDNSVKLVGPMKNVSIAGQSFRQSLQTHGGGPSWLTSDVLTKTLATFTGDMTNAQLAAEGFTQAQIKSIQITAKTAFNAATQVKTLSQLLQVTKETAATGWANTWQIVFGNFAEAKKTFTALSNAINNFINVNAAARNKVLGDWKALGGRVVLIEALKSTFKDFALVIRAFRNGFREIFPRKTGKELFSLTVQFKKFADDMRPSGKTLEALKRTFAGFFAILDIGKQVFVGIFSFFKQLFVAVGGGQGHFLGLTASIGDFFVSLDKTLKKGDSVKKFFTKLALAVSVPIKIFKAFATAIGNLFRGFDPGGITTGINGMTKAMSPFQKLVVFAGKVWHKFIDSFQNASPIFQTVAQAFGKFAMSLGPALNTAIQHINFEAILQVIRTGLLVGMFVMIRDFLGKGAFSTQLGRVFGKQFGKLGGGLIKNVNKSLIGFSGTMQSMQTNLKAKTLKEIAIAIALLAVSILALSLVDPKRLNSAMTAVVILLGELVGAMKIIDKFISTGGAVKIPIIASSLILLGVAINTFTIAVFALSRLSWDQLKKGLTGVTVLLGGLTAVAGPLGKSAPGMIRAGIGISAIGVGLNIMAVAVKQFGSMNLKELGKGLGSVAASLVIVGLAIQTFPKLAILQGPALIAVAVGLNIMAKAISQIGNLKGDVIKKGLLGIAGGLVIIAGAMQLMPVSLPITAAGLVLVSFALGKIGAAIATMGNLPIEQIKKGLVTLGAAMLILAAGLNAMSGTLAGAAALGVAAAGIAILTPMLVILGKQSWREIIKGLVTLAGAFAVLGAAGLALSPVIPALLGLGAALVLIGGGLALAGVGIALIGVGLSAIAVAGPVAVGVLVQAMTDLSQALPEMVKNLLIGLLQVVDALSATAPKFVEAIVKILSLVADAIIKIAPKIAQVAIALIDVIVKVLHDRGPALIQAGLNLILNLLTGLKQNIKAIVKQAADVIVNFLNGLSNQATRLIGAGANLIASIVVGIVSGLGHVVTAGIDAAGRFLVGFAKHLVKLADRGAQALIDFLNGVAKVIKRREPEVLRAFANVGAAIIDGMVKGLGDNAKRLYKKITDIGKKALDYAKHPWKAFSPSREMIELGKNVIEGFVIGISKHATKASKSAENMSKSVIAAVKAAFGIKSPSKVMEEIGRDVNQGFAVGIRGSSDDVKNAFTELNNRLIDAASSARDTIATEQKKLDELMKHPVKNAAAIKEARKIIQENQTILAESTAGHVTLVKTLKSEKKELLGLIAQYTVIGNKLDAAKQALADAKQARKDAFDTISGQFGTLPSIDTSAVDQLQTYEDTLKKTSDAVAAYHKTLDKLRKLGLDKATFQKLLDDGTVDQTFADQLLAGGATAVKALNKLDSQLQGNANSLAKSASRSLYQAGVDAAQGLVDGLTAKKANLQHLMNDLANSMVASIKHSLKIKSPSEVFAEIGRQTSRGLAQGLTQSSVLVTDAVNGISNDATAAMRNSLGSISDIVLGEVDANPTITPVLDLSAVKKGATELSGIINKNPVGSVSLDKASIISAAQLQVQTEATTPVSSETNITFTQNNHSPEALSPIEIYRQTNNQLSRLRSAVLP